MAVLMLAIWLPGTSHILLESAGVIHEQHSADSDFDHDAADGLVLLPSGVNAPVMSVTLVCVLPDVVALLPESFAGRATRIVGSGTSPPLRNVWHFLHRTALPVRAPSFVS